MSCAREEEEEEEEENPRRRKRRGRRRRRKRRRRKRRRKRRTRRTRRRSAPARSSEDAPRSIRAIALVHRGEAIALAVRALLAVAPGAAARRVLLRVRARRGLRLVQDDGPLGTIIPYSEQVSE
ncbi:unnamed protein product [Prorocentrum cordatum]|uniref:Uncharacterized protein n=1 Tax=Prorocentrum cordatum TaxID=2364126 RepID=A0ABN9QFH7_9DINO|nr:unnamed protein product [Polarella glacialis]